MKNSGLYTITLTDDEMFDLMGVLLDAKYVSPKSSEVDLLRKEAKNVLRSLKGSVKYEVIL